MNNINVAVSGASLVPLFCLRLRALIGMMTLSLSLITNLYQIRSFKFKKKILLKMEVKATCPSSHGDGAYMVSL